MQLPINVTVDPRVPPDRVLIGSFPDTIITTFHGRETYVTLGYLRDLAEQWPGVSFDNPIGYAQMGTESITVVVKPISAATEDDVVALARNPGMGLSPEQLRRMATIKGL